MGQNKLKQVVLLFIFDCSDRGVEREERICCGALALPDVCVDV